MDFISLDVETANADMSSICQIGLASFRHGLLHESWKTYIDPEDFFDEMNVAMHGITESTVKGAPTLLDIADLLYSYLDDRIAVCHTCFDRMVIHQACIKHHLRLPTCTWLDSARVTRRAWEQFADRRCGLADVCETIGYPFTRHDALEDAKAAAHVLLAAIEETGIDLHGWLKRVEQPIDLSDPPCNSSGDGNPEGFLYGEVIVFTGALHIPRREAACMAAKMGCTVADGVTKNTTILVVGDRDIQKLAGYEKTSNHRKAEASIKKGQSLRMMRESDFKALANQAGLIPCGR